MRLPPSKLVVVGVSAVVIAGVAPLGGCKTKRIVTHSAELTGYKAEGNAAYARGDYDAALGHYWAYVNERPQSAWGRHRLGLTYMAMGEPRYAREQFDVAYDLEPENTAYAEALADSLLELGEVAALFEHLELLADRDPTSAGHIRTARYAERLGFMDEALAAYRKGVALDGRTSPEPHRAMADFRRRIGDREGEVRSLRKVLWFDGTDAQATARLEELGEIVGPSFALQPGADG